jgi:hypothetical protein
MKERRVKNNEYCRVRQDREERIEERTADRRKERKLREEGVLLLSSFTSLSVIESFSLPKYREL